MIDILIPVLGRPQNAQPLVDSIRATTTTEHTIRFFCNRDDDDQITACHATGADVYTVGWNAGPADFAKKINLGVLRSKADWVFMGADDLTFEPGWDTHALASAGDLFHVVATNDLANANVRKGQFGTHCLIRRRYVTEQGGTGENQEGVTLHEGYDHNFVDRELCHVAESLGVFVFARHSRVKHRHPLWRTAPHDKTYRKALKKFREDQRLFLTRAHLWGYVGLSDHERKLAA